MVCRLFIRPTRAKYDGGTGEANNLYLIDPPEQMNAFEAGANGWDKHYRTPWKYRFPEDAVRQIGI